MMAWITQGPLTPRNLEHLGVSDRGVILYRNMLSDAINAVERGEDPPCLVRDPAKNIQCSPIVARRTLGWPALPSSSPAAECRGRGNTQARMGMAWHRRLRSLCRAASPQDQTRCPVTAA